MTQTTELMTPKEVAAYVRVSLDTVMDWLQHGKLKGRKYGHQWRIRKADVDSMGEKGDNKKKARSARYQMTRAIQQKMLSEGEE